MEREGIQADHMTVCQFMGIETSADHGGAECGFTSAIIVIEGTLGANKSEKLELIRHNLRRAGKGGSIRIGYVRCAQYTGQHYPASLRYPRDQGQIPARHEHEQGEKPA